MRKRAILIKVLKLFVCDIFDTRQLSKIDSIGKVLPYIKIMIKNKYKNGSSSYIKNNV